MPVSKSMAQHKLEGTLKSRHKEKVKTEDYFADNVVKKESGLLSLNPPSELKDDEVIKQYKQHAETLLRLNLLAPMDCGDFNTMYVYLQKAKDFLKKSNEVDMEEDFQLWSECNKQFLKFSSKYSELARHYFVSPLARQKMTLNELEIEQKKNETAISKILNKNK